MEPKWKIFERLVAAIHQAMDTIGATVEWEEKLDGREFDVTIRFDSFGYKYLTVIECRDYDVPVGDIEAFVTKSRRAKANKAIMVSSEGFQSGGMKVARDEAIELYVLKEAQDWPEQVTVKQSVPALAITDIEMVNQAGKVIHVFPTESSALEYFMLQSKCVQQNSPVRTLHELIMAEQPWAGRLTAQKQRFTIALPPNSTVNIPYLDPLSGSELRLNAAIVSALIIDSGGIDPSMIPVLFSFKNVFTGENRNISEADLWIGFKTEV